MDIHPPESLGFSSARLARIQTVMRRYIDEEKIAGVVTLIARRGKVAHFEALGMADVEHKLPMQLDSIFRIYSMTKPITSAAILMLMEEGLLRISDPVSRYLPTFKNQKVLVTPSDPDSLQVDAHREITIHDLLTHTAGLSYGFDKNHYLDELYEKRVWKLQEKNPDLTLLEMVSAVGELPLAFQPGSQFRYSIATDVLGCLVQVISGMPFADFLQQRILDPLGMPDSGFMVPPEKLERFTVTYGPGEPRGLKVVDARAGSRFTRPTPRPSGGGGMVSTTLDYLRFSQMLLNGGELDGVRLLGRKTIEWMRANHLPPGVHPMGDKAFGFGLGGNVLIDLGQSPVPGSPGNFGWSGAAATNFWIDPQEQLTGILMLQFMPGDTYPLTRDFRILTYQALVD